MWIRFDRRQATAVVRRADADVEAGRIDSRWREKVATLSGLCEASESRTHIAFIGTAMLAKVLRADVDLFAVKPTANPGNPRTYSARTLCHGVLVPLAVDLGFSLGVTGREPLNNQPYFRIGRIGDGTPVHARARDAFEYVCGLVESLQECESKEARGALAAFVAERRLYVPSHVDPKAVGSISPEDLLAAVRGLVGEASERGRRAQAVVAGLMDAFAGPDRVESGRINDPSRNHPGDVCVRADEPPGHWERVFEVRDKPVSLSDIQLFAHRCAEAGVREAAVVAVADDQPTIDRDRLAEWANGLGMAVTIFAGWSTIVPQALFWANDPKPEAARRAAEYIHRRLRGVESSNDAIVLWSRLTRMPEPE